MICETNMNGWRFLFVCFSWYTYCWFLFLIQRCAAGSRCWPNSVHWLQLPRSSSVGGRGQSSTSTCRPLLENPPYAATVTGKPVNLCEICSSAERYRSHNDVIVLMRCRHVTISSMLLAGGWTFLLNSLCLSTISACSETETAAPKQTQSKMNKLFWEG